MNAGEPGSTHGFIPAMHTSESTPIPKLSEKYNLTFVTVRNVTHTEVYEEAADGQVVGEATSLYDKYWKPNWNLWHPFANVFDCQQAHALGRQSKL